MRDVKYVSTKAVVGSLFLTSLVGGIVAGLELLDPFRCSIVAIMTFVSASLLAILMFGIAEEEKITQGYCRVKLYLFSIMWLMVLLVMTAYGITYEFDVFLGMCYVMISGPIAGFLVVAQAIILSFLGVGIWRSLFESEHSEPVSSEA